MKRIIFLIFLAALFVPAGYFGSEALSELSEMTEARKAREQSNRGRIMRILKADERYLFQQVVVGPGDDVQQLDFRARAYRDGIGQAAYGAIRTDCAPPAEDAGCWELASLYVDGISVQQEPGVKAVPDEDQSVETTGTLAKQDGTPSSATVAEPLPQSSNEGTPELETTLRVTPIPDAADSTSASSLELLGSLRPTHSVRPSLANARDAPRGQAVTQLPRGTPLHMLERRGGWGQFKLLDGDQAGLEVWVAFSVLDSI